jgi:hypothetical protein
MINQPFDWIVLAVYFPQNIIIIIIIIINNKATLT